MVAKDPPGHLIYCLFVLGKTVGSEYHRPFVDAEVEVGGDEQLPTLTKPVEL